jgi:hypothetical protein
MPTKTQMKLKSRIAGAIKDGDANSLAGELVLERIPFVFKNDWKVFREWKMKLGERIDIDSCDIFLTGSAATGVSLNPYKNLSFFSDESDIDVAIVSAFHFDTAWRHLRGLRRSAVQNREWDAIRSHKENYIYWGCIATDRILHLLPFATPWLEALSYMEGMPPADGRKVKARIYRDARSLRDYTASTLRSLKATLVEMA